jgi:hypothetical protein
MQTKARFPFALLICWLAILGVGRAVGASEPSFTYEDVAGLIQQRNLTSLEQLLPLLPESLRSSFTLMYDSRSLQAADARNPRAILFGKDASLVLAFNGDGAQRGFDDLEVIQYRPASRSFEMRRIQFPSPRNGFDKVQFSAANPPLCLGCHGRDPRPNWERYPVWPGAYGSEDDELTPGEEASYRAFRKQQPAHPRYRELHARGPQDDPELNPYRRSLLDRMFRPNLKLTKLVARLNAFRLARLLEQQPLPVQRSIEAILLYCPGAVGEGVLQAALSPLGLDGRAWTPGFRRFQDEQPQGDYAYGFGEGSFELNDLLAARLLDDWVKAGATGMLPYDTMDPQAIHGDSGDIDAIVNALGAPLVFTPQARDSLCRELSGT